MSDKEIAITSYQIKQSMYKEVTPLDAITVMKNITEISKKMLNSSSYYMLLNNENKDYTVFHINNKKDIETLKKSILEALQNRGKILDMYDTPEGAWEIWLRENEECFVYILFDYSLGVVEI